MTVVMLLRTIRAMLPHIYDYPLERHINNRIQVRSQAAGRRVPKEQRCTHIDILHRQSAGITAGKPVKTASMRVVRTASGSTVKSAETGANSSSETASPYALGNTVT